MKICISLNELGPAMWFLGDNTKKLKASLTFANPGPVIIDFCGLSEEEQTSILYAIRDKKIVCDISFDELYKFFRNQKDGGEPEKSPPPEVENYLQQIKAKKDQEELLKKEKDIIEKNNKNIERLKQNLKGSLRAVQSSLAKEWDLKQLSLILKLEEEGKNRQSVKDMILARIDKACQIINKKAAESTNNLKVLNKRETSMEDVIESDSKIIRF